MIYTPEEHEKIKMLDRVFSSISVDEFKEILGSDMVVSRLKGVPEKDGVMLQLLKAADLASMEITNLRSESQMLRSDIQTLIRCLNRGLGDPTICSDFSTLKQRHGIY